MVLVYMAFGVYGVRQCVNIVTAIFNGSKSAMYALILQNSYILTI